MAAFKRAERRQTKLKIALTGPSGAGKTFSALTLATGIGKRVAVADTENGSASLYADRFQFDTLEIRPPYTIAKYIEAIRSAQAEGYDVLIIDSISQAWAGEGGLLAKKEALDARGGNSYVNWAKITPEQEQFKSVLLNAGLHLICTMRSKQDYVLEVNEKGKQAPRKVGLAPIQRDGMEYEFTTVFDIAMDHHAQASKDRTSLFDGQLLKLTADTGKQFMAWLLEGKDVPAPAPMAEPVQASATTAAAPVDRNVPPAAKEQVPDKGGAPCLQCQAELILHKDRSGSPLGYACPNKQSTKDGHAQVLLAEMTKYRKQFAAAPA